LSYHIAWLENGFAAADIFAAAIFAAKQAANRALLLPICQRELPSKVLLLLRWQEGF
jgi:hypothetical protein